MQVQNREQIAGMLAGLLAEPAKVDSRDLLRRLSAPFPADGVSWRVGVTTKDKSKGMALAYIDSRDVQDRLDDVMGADWQCEYAAMPDGSYCCRIGLLIDGQWRWRSDGAVMIATSDKVDPTEMATKGQYSDSFKRAAVKWGIGRYLYDVPNPWVELQPRGDSFVMAPNAQNQLRGHLAKWMRDRGFTSDGGPLKDAGPQPAPDAPKDAEPPPAQPAAPKAAAPDKSAAKPAAKPQPPKPAAAAPKPAPPIVPADGEPVAATLIEGIPHHMGLREITLRYVAATKHAQGKQAEYTAGGKTYYLMPAECTKAALDAAADEWAAWRKSMWPKMSDDDRSAVLKAVDGWTAAAKKFDAAIERQAKTRAKAAADAGAAPDTGELPNHDGGEPIGQNMGEAV